MGQATDRSHVAVVEAWRQQRYAALRREMGWLTLAGLDWLRPGVNRVGTGPGVDIVLPDGPADAGTIILTHAGAVADGAIARGATIPLETDKDGREPTLLELGRLRMCLIQRGDRVGLRTWDTASVQRTTFTGIDHYPVDPTWRLRARLEPAREFTIAVPDVLGDVQDEVSPGTVVFEVDGDEQRLDALEGGPNGELWLVFGDATNGVTTYGGGRFLYTSAPEADGALWIDFNRAYNPPCVFSPYATCPLPPRQNRLAVAVEAGERTYEPPHGASSHRSG
jgi:uncharacterized protein (DUF1684 family)